MDYPEFPGSLVINTDGSSFRNGKKDAIAGVGVFFGKRDARNVGVPLGPGKQTNQRAELMAIKIALDKAPVIADVVIRSDSMYAIECITSWYPKWELASWKAPAGILKENNALIELILRRMRVRNLAGAQTRFFWVKGYAGDEGNERADKLAVQGSRRAWNQRKYRGRARGRVVRRAPPVVQKAVPAPIQKKVRFADMNDI
ncbi:Nn.00g104740.m01.CDS01 [Neocucurbitaria sp. VM-36]